MKYLKKTFLSIEKFIDNFNGKKKKYMIYFKFFEIKKKPNLQSYKDSIHSIIANQKLYYILYTFGVHDFVYRNYGYLKKKKIISYLDKIFIFTKRKLFFLKNMYSNLKRTNFNSYLLAIKSFKTKYRIRFMKNEIKINYKKNMINTIEKFLTIWIKLFVIIYRIYQKKKRGHVSIMRKSVRLFREKKDLEFIFFLNFLATKKIKKKTKNFSDIYNFIKNKIKFKPLYQYVKFTSFDKIQITQWTIDNYNISCKKIFMKCRYKNSIKNKNINKIKLIHRYKKQLKIEAVYSKIFGHIIFN